MKTLRLLLTIVALLSLAGCAAPGPAVQTIKSDISTIGKELASNPSGINLLGPLETYQSTMENIYNQVAPSVVNIEANSSSADSLGSGFIWDTQGNIVTNNHVIDGGGKITITFFDGTQVSAKLIGADPNSDLAVLSVKAPADLLKPITPGNSDTVRVGQVVVAIGNPFGLQGTMTSGIISGLNRSIPVEKRNKKTSVNIPDIIQTDAPLNPGNSGGVLVDIYGKIIGVPSAIESPVDANSGVGFVIPMNIVQKIVPVLIQKGSYDHPWLGIDGTMLTPDIAQAMGVDQNLNGVLVTDVLPGGPAQDAGLLPSNNQVTLNGQALAIGGDIILKVNGQPIVSYDDLLAYLFLNTKPDDTITLAVLRNGQQQNVQLKLGVLPD